MEKILRKNLTTSQKTQMMTRMAILTAIGAVLYRIEIPLLVAHQKIDPSLIPSLVGGIMMGPLAGVTIELLKNFTHLFVTSSAGIGELINFIVGSSLIIPVCIIYRSKQTMTSYIVAALIATVSIFAVGALCNYIFTPVFYAVMGLPSPSTTEIMAFVSASFLLNGLKAAVTLIPTFFMLPMLKRNSL
ncbi:MAG: ECF transporter S component [Clostridia bacterium]